MICKFRYIHLSTFLLSSFFLLLLLLLLLLLVPLLYFNSIFKPIQLIFASALEPKRNHVFGYLIAMQTFGPKRGVKLIDFFHRRGRRGVIKVEQLRELFISVAEIICSSLLNKLFVSLGILKQEIWGLDWKNKFWRYKIRLKKWLKKAKRYHE